MNDEPARFAIITALKSSTLHSLFGSATKDTSLASEKSSRITFEIREISPRGGGAAFTYPIWPLSAHYKKLISFSFFRYEIDL